MAKCGTKKQRVQVKLKTNLLRDAENASKEVFK